MPRHLENSVTKPSSVLSILIVTERFGDGKNEEMKPKHLITIVKHTKGCNGLGLNGGCSSR